MEDKPFRWNLREHRALEAMIARELEAAELIVAPQKKGKLQHYDQDYSKQLVRYRKLKCFAREMRNALKEAESHTQDLLECCARVLALCCNYDPVFVGRSPEPIFDHLSGLLYDTPFKARLTLLHYSNVRDVENKVYWETAVPALKRYLVALKLDPRSIAQRKRPVVFVDMVDSGWTFRDLMTFYEKWSAAIGVDWKILRTKIRIVGIVRREKTSPKAFRWQQQKQWQGLLEPNSIKNTSADGTFLLYLASWSAHKATESFTSSSWGAESAYVPTRTESTLIGLRLALKWFDLGRSDKRRKAFASLLSKQEEMKEPELRKLVLLLRRTSSQ